jgi:hypothetical protein
MLLLVIYISGTSLIQVQHKLNMLALNLPCYWKVSLPQRSLYNFSVSVSPNGILNVLSAQSFVTHDFSTLQAHKYTFFYSGHIDKQKFMFQAAEMRTSSRLQRD